MALSSVLLASGIGLANISNKVEAVSKYSTKYHRVVMTRNTYFMSKPYVEEDLIDKGIDLRIRWVPKNKYFQAKNSDIGASKKLIIYKHGKDTSWFKNKLASSKGAKHSLNSSYWTKYRRVKVLKATTFKRFDALTRRYIGGLKTFHRGNVIKVRLCW